MLELVQVQGHPGILQTRQILSSMVYMRVWRSQKHFDAV